MLAPLFTLFRQSAVHSNPAVLRASARQDGPPAPAGAMHIALQPPMGTVPGSAATRQLLIGPPPCSPVVEADR
jgi:hypothetical protein